MKIVLVEDNHFYTSSIIKAGASLQFGTKAENLYCLQNRIKNAQILSLLYFSIDEWKQNQELLIKKVISHYNGEKIIVRSSARCEDSIDGSTTTFYEGLSQSSNIIQEDEDFPMSEEFGIQDSTHSVDDNVESLFAPVLTQQSEIHPGNMFERLKNGFYVIP